VREVANKTVNPSRVTWLVVGDRVKEMKELQDLGYDEVILIDSDGNLLEPEDQKVELENKK